MIYKHMNIKIHNESNNYLLSTYIKLLKKLQNENCNNLFQGLINKKSFLYEWLMSPIHKHV